MSLLACAFHSCTPARSPPRLIAPSLFSYSSRSSTDISRLALIRTDYFDFFLGNLSSFAIFLSIISTLYVCILSRRPGSPPFFFRLIITDDV
ncbi:hypothetical protein DL93DRAFT_1886110 [Clavulina sp. PMI_390]|nr:hypothetical protein DL93DRAFT_1886110 [Clavulina sp. PMI_390]